MDDDMYIDLEPSAVRRASRAGSSFDDEVEARQILTAVSRVVDMKACMKVPTFSGTASDWPDYQFKMRTIFDLLGISAMIAEALATSDEDFDRRAMAGTARGYDQVLYTMLVSGCKGRAAAVVRLLPFGAGFHAWRRILGEYEPAQASRHVAMLMGILDPAWKSQDTRTFSTDLLKWERQVMDYSTATLHGVRDEVKIAVVLKHAPNDVRSWLRGRESMRSNRYDDMRKDLMIYIAQGDTFDASGGRLREGGFQRPEAVPDPMEVDAVGKAKGKVKQATSRRIATWA
jgi:hypothetical protein